MTVSQRVFLVLCPLPLLGMLLAQSLVPSDPGRVQGDYVPWLEALVVSGVLSLVLSVIGLRMALESRPRRIWTLGAATLIAAAPLLVGIVMPLLAQVLELLLGR